VQKMATQLKTVAEVKQHFAGVKQTKNVQICFKTALRTVDGKDKKQNIPYPVLLPANGTKVSDYFADIEKLDYDAKDILKTGFVLYFSKKFVPASSVLMPSRSPKAKNCPDSFYDNFIAELSKTPDGIKAIVAGKSRDLANAAWAKVPAGQVGEYICVSDDLATELEENAKVALAEFTINQ